jgi:hypothetical protein
LPRAFPLPRMKDGGRDSKWRRHLPLLIRRFLKRPAKPDPHRDGFSQLEV